MKALWSLLALYLWEHGQCNEHANQGSSPSRFLILQVILIFSVTPMKYHLLNKQIHRVKVYNRQTPAATAMSLAKCPLLQVATESLWLRGSFFKSTFHTSLGLTCLSCHPGAPHTVLQAGQAGPAHSLLSWLCTLHTKSHEAASDIPKCSLFMVSAFVLSPFKQLGNHLLNSRAICPWHLIYQSPTFPERWSLVMGFWGTGQVPLCACVKMEWDSGRQFSLNLSAFITILLSSASSDLWPVSQKQWRPAAQTDQLSDQT